MLRLPPAVKMTKLGFLRLSYEKQDTLLKLLILSMAAVLCKSTSCWAALGTAARAPRGAPQEGATLLFLLFPWEAPGWVR